MNIFLDIPAGYVLVKEVRAGKTGAFVSGCYTSYQVQSRQVEPAIIIAITICFQTR